MPVTTAIAPTGGGTTSLPSTRIPGGIGAVTRQRPVVDVEHGRLRVRDASARAHQNSDVVQPEPSGHTALPAPLSVL